jgi:tetratricopeptide (TPR) repeat protein
LQHELAGSLQNRGAAKDNSGDFAGAIADYDAAIGLMQAIRAALGERWPPPMQNDLAGSLYNRALAKRSLHDEAGAHVDVDAAVAVQESLVDSLGATCPASYRWSLEVIGESRRALFF